MRLKLFDRVIEDSDWTSSPHATTRETWHASTPALLLLAAAIVGLRFLFF